MTSLPINFNTAPKLVCLDYKNTLEKCTLEQAPAWKHFVDAILANGNDICVLVNSGNLSGPMCQMDVLEVFSDHRIKKEKGNCQLAS